MDTLTSPERDPEQALMAKEATELLERAVTSLSDDFRQVFMLREVEGLSTVETAECLGINEDAVKTRLHRARRQLQRHLTSQVEAAAPGAFHLHARRCDRVVANVLAAIAQETPHATVRLKD